MRNIPVLIFHMTISALWDVRRLIRVWVNPRTCRSQRGESLRGASRHCILEDAASVFSSFSISRVCHSVHENLARINCTLLFFSIDSVLKSYLRESILSNSLSPHLHLYFLIVLHVIRGMNFSNIFLLFSSV